MLKKIAFVFVCINLVLLGCILYINSSYKNNFYKKKAAVFQENLSASEFLLKQKTKQLLKHKDVFKETIEDFSFYIYYNDTLENWSSHETSVDFILKQGSFSKVAFYKNGWYLTHLEKQNNTTAVGLFKIKNSYPTENHILKNTFSTHLIDGEFFDLGLEKKSKSFSINVSQLVQLYLYPKTNDTHSKLKHLYPLFYLSAFILLICSISLFLKPVKAEILSVITTLFFSIILFLSHFENIYIFILGALLFAYLFHLLSKVKLNNTFLQNLYSGLLFVVCIVLIQQFITHSYLNTELVVELTEFVSFDLQTWLYYLSIFICCIALWSSFNAFKLIHLTNKKILHAFYFLILCAFFLSTVFTYAYHKRKQIEAINVLESLKQKQDVNLELNVQNYAEDIYKFTQEQIYELNEKDIDIEYYINELQNSYFSKFLTKYQIDAYVYEANQINYFTSKEPIDFSELKNYLTASKSRFQENLYNTHGLAKEVDYLMQVATQNKKTVYLTFSSKSYKDIIGFPALFSQTSKQKKVHSYAYYKNDLLSFKEGNYNFKTQIKKEHFATDKAFEHFIYSDKNLKIVVSQPNKSFTDHLNLFSILLLLLSIFSLIYYLLFIYLFKDSGNYSIAQKLQIFLLSTLFLAIISVSIGTYISSKKDFNTRNKALLEDKLRSVLFEVEHKVSKKSTLNVKDKPFLERILNKFSNVFYADISLFDKQGKLIASSASSIFKSGILSTRMHPIAFSKLQDFNQPKILQDESIEQMHYLSAYVPVYNKKGDFLAYLNLPYFVKQEAFEQEWGRFLSSILNVYSVLLLVLLLASIFVANVLTSPLRTVQEMLENVDSNREDQRLEYHGKNEIGDLVKVYNKKVEQLSEKSKALAESEKKLAWREMAKQVAHEIKNPLTPMKLSVQHLVRSLGVKTSDDQKQLSTFGQRIEEQINVLSRIASEFSDFAQMPKAKKKSIDLALITKDIVGLFTQSSASGIHFSMPTDDCTVLADKDQMMRVIQNLIKNAIQATQSIADAKIKVKLEVSKKSIVFRIIDNGVGIHAEIQDKIFVPNFTTKTSGKGLGLAMCKQIIEAHGGTIDFESEKGKTHFFFELKKS